MCINVHRLWFTSYWEVKIRDSNTAYLLCTEHFMFLRANLAFRQMLLLPWVQMQWPRPSLIRSSLFCILGSFFYIWPLANKIAYEVEPFPFCRIWVSAFSNTKRLNPCHSVRDFLKCNSCSFVHSFQAQLPVAIEGCLWSLFWRILVLIPDWLCKLLLGDTELQNNLCTQVMHDTIAFWTVSFKRFW